MVKQAYPLSWPTGYKRTQYRIDSKFKRSLDSAQQELHYEQAIKFDNATAN